MGRSSPVASGGTTSMYLLLYCCIIYQSSAHHPANLYPVLPEENSQPEEEKIQDLDNVQPAESKREELTVQLGAPVSKVYDSPSYEITSEAYNLKDESAEGVQDVLKKLLDQNNKDILLIAIISGCSAAALAGIVILLYGWYRLHKKSKAAADVEYPAYGVTGPNKGVSPTGDRRLAESAQMYHYQHQKQQIIAMENNRTNNERRGSLSEGDSDEENEEGDYTVYECPGLAATGELEVKNPLFQDDPTPAAGNHVNGDLPDTEDLK